MTMIGCTMMCEQAGPKELVRDVPRTGGTTSSCRAATSFPLVELLS